MAEKQVVMIIEGPYGPSILYSDGSTDFLPIEDVRPPPLVGDINFEGTRTGFEVWLSERVFRDHESLIEGFIKWLREQPQVVSTDLDTLGVVRVLGVIDEALKAKVTTWWTEKIPGLELDT